METFNEISDILSSVPKDILVHEISRHLAPIDIFNLYKTSKHFNHLHLHQIYNKSGLFAIHTRLYSIFGDKTDEFITSLDESYGVISGSFIPQCLLNEYWKDSDIDIYLPLWAKDFSPLENFLYKHYAFVDEGSGVSYINNFSIISNGVNVDYIRNYKVTTLDRDYIIQILHLDIDNMNTPERLSIPSQIEDYISSNFDFNFLKNYYYKNRLVFDGKLLSKTAMFWTSTDLISSIKRCYKYQNRGFRFVNLKQLDLFSLINRHVCQLNPLVRQIEIFTFIKSEELLLGSKSAIKRIKTGKITLKCKDLYGDTQSVMYNEAVCSTNCIFKFLNLSREHVHLMPKGIAYTKNETDIIIMYV